MSRVLPHSLAARLFLAALVVLPLTLGAMGWMLERAHRTALDAATSERLQLQVVSLLAQADVSSEFDLPLNPLDTRLLQPGSGLYALVTDGQNQPLWISPSAALLEAPIQRLTAGIPVMQPGERHDSEQDGLLRHAYQVLWELEDGELQPLRFLVAESSLPREADVQAFRSQLLFWLVGTLLLLLGAQFLITRWGLNPLRELAHRVADIEAGKERELNGQWPREINPLAENLETLLKGEQQRRARMRNTLADLAHSLKTPLAVLRSADAKSAEFADMQAEQLDRMEEVIGWHLQRAVGGSHRLLHRVPVLPVAERLRETLLKVYSERQLSFSVEGDADSRYRGDERDLMEILGNLLDNACKYSHGRIEVKVSRGEDGDSLRIVIDDDGDGVSPELRDSLMQRGMRADTRREGQGIGLAVVLEIVASQDGELELGESPLGGTRVTVTFA